jgi:hypothetical protein
VVATTTMHLAWLTEGRFCVGAAGLITNLNLGEKFFNFFQAFVFNGDKENIPILKNKWPLLQCS